MKCFYHSADLDGHCSGAIVKMKYPDCEMIGINYGDEFPWGSIGEDEKVFMVDFSLPIDDMVRLRQMCELHWIDHHETAIKAAREACLFPCGITKVGEAGCELTWEYLYNTSVPLTVTLLGRYDVWDHKDPRVLPFQHGMRAFGNTRPERQAIWRPLFEEEDTKVFSDIALKKGRTILDYETGENEKQAKSYAFDMEWEGLHWVAANRLMTNSKFFDSVFDPEKHDAMLLFGFRDGRWCFSLYGENPKQHLGELAQKFGGGGHAGAAGFDCDRLPFFLPLKYDHKS